MACPTFTASDSSKQIQWVWQSNPNPWSSSELPEWSHYSDIENLIIEEAFSKKQSEAMLDGYCLDFKNHVQISVDGEKKQRPIKRLEGKTKEECLRKERFMFDPIAPKRPFSGQYGWISPFIVEVRRDLGLRKDQLPSKNKDVMTMLVDRAALGIIEEGKLIGKQYEGKKLADMLREQQDEEFQEVWKWCAYLYSLTSFLHKKLNEVMRLIGSEEHEQIWRSKVRTLGPFSLLLWDDPINKKMKTRSILYRGCDLTDEQIATYTDMVEHPTEYRSFQAFTSCSRTMDVGHCFSGNVLFIMKVQFAFTADLSPWSQYPDEEEELLIPGVCFTVEHMEFDEKTKKHLIHLLLKQRFSERDNDQIKKVINFDLISDEYDSTGSIPGEGVIRRDYDGEIKGFLGALGMACWMAGDPRALKYDYHFFDRDGDWCE